MSNFASTSGVGKRDPGDFFPGARFQHGNWRSRGPELTHEFCECGNFICGS